MGHFSIIVVAAGLLTISLVLVNARDATHAADQELAEHQYKSLARDAAVTGQHLTVRKLAADTDPWTTGADYEFTSTDFRSGSFEVDVTPVGTPLGDTVDVTATGTNGPQTQVIQARYAREYADGGIPPAFRNVITTDLYIQLKGTVNIRAINKTFNASIHTNGDLETYGNSFVVEGYGTYTGDAYTNQEDNFTPNIDYNEDDPNVFWADSVRIPDIDLDAMRNKATTITPTPSNGDPYVVDGDATPVIDFADYGPGKPDDPSIWYVEGPLNFVNRVEFKGYGVIVSEGDVLIDPKGEDGGVMGGLAGDETTSMVMTPGAINIAGNANLGEGDFTNGFTKGLTLYAGTEVEFQGTPFMVGGIVTPETHFKGGGTPEIIYAAPTETITDPGFEYIVPVGPVLIAYSEW